MSQVIDIRRYEKRTPSARRPSDEMVWVPPGTLPPADGRRPDNAPERRVYVDGFWIDRYPVTNERFRAFVNATGYVTAAERAVDAARHGRTPPDLRHAGSLVFVQPHRSIDSLELRDWWLYLRGAQWRHPHGPHSTLDDLSRHPVVHVTYDDAQAYARWAGKKLPTEVQWEHAARGAHGGERSFPHPIGRRSGHRFDEAHATSSREPVWETSPVDRSSANGYEPHDTMGNVWEWTSDNYVSPDLHERIRLRGIPSELRPDRQNAAYKVIKGGSHVYANGCVRCRHPRARMPQRTDISTCDVGFRCVSSVRGGRI